MNILETSGRKMMTKGMRKMRINFIGGMGRPLKVIFKMGENSEEILRQDLQASRL